MTPQTAPLYTHEESTVTTSDGVILYTQSWRAAQPKGAIALIHGIAEHSARYRHVGEFFATHGYTVHTMDLRGHGRSPGYRILIRQMDEYSQDVVAFLTWIRAQERKRPLFLLGHSMGGLIATYHVLTQQPDLRGVVLSAPALQVDGVTAFERIIGRVLARLAPALPMKKLDATAISRNPAVVKAYQRDPLVYLGAVPAATGIAMITAIAEIEQQMEAFRLPLLIVHGSADRLTNPEGSKQLYARAGSTDKTFKLYDGLYHEVLNEPEQEQVMADIVTWLDQRI